jgi:hypothetical protein
MVRESPVWIEFINGPFDGHLELVPSRSLPENIVCFVSENVFRMLEGRPRLSKSRFTSVAVYQRQSRSERMVYCFAGAVAPQAIRLEPALGTPPARS